MATADITTLWTHASPQSKLTAKRDNWSNETAAAVHVAVVLGGGSSSDPASGGSGPFTHTVTWTHGVTTFESTCRSFVSQADADALAEALKDEIVAAGGTVVSG